MILSPKAGVLAGLGRRATMVLGLRYLRALALALIGPLPFLSDGEQKVDGMGLDGWNRWYHRSSKSTFSANKSFKFSCMKTFIRLQTLIG